VRHYIPAMLVAFITLSVGLRPCAAQTSEDEPARIVNPESLPLLGGVTTSPEKLLTFLWTRPFEFTYRGAHWELESNDGLGGVLLRWGVSGPTLAISVGRIEALAATSAKRLVKGRPVNDRGAKTARTTLGGSVASEILEWQEPEIGRPLIYVHTLWCEHGGKQFNLVLTVPAKSEAVIGACGTELREIQGNWRWHASVSGVKK
jgi:hypothetical protein